MLRTSKRAFGFGALIQKIQNINIKWESKFHGNEDFETAEYAWYLREPLEITAFCEGYVKFNAKKQNDFVCRETIFKQNIWHHRCDWWIISDYEWDSLEEHLDGIRAAAFHDSMDPRVRLK